MSRRFLLGEQVLDEEDSVNDVSAAGNLMNCGNLQVDQVRLKSSETQEWLSIGDHLCLQLQNHQLHLRAIISSRIEAGFLQEKVLGWV